ncbi:hypothetical protein F8M41_003482 [Gigaspora margarita]|uniref:Sodium/calcium exchanger membrane region domain-containing protein n=1 Tax=Gigaspora margarita TaxID=4874 RepID=A0A8H3XE98_GIGMA|nr:hypothetical protein F8M41_003482 [Gigaspora margarita]
MTILGNLPDLIMMGPFFSKGHSEIVHGIIIGNLVSTPLLLGAGTLIGCYKNTMLKFDKIMGQNYAYLILFYLSIYFFSSYTNLTVLVFRFINIVFLLVYFCYLYYIFSIYPKILSKENESKDKSSNGSDVSIDIYNETECLKITKYFKLNILLQLFILVIASVIVFLISNVMESLVKNLPFSENFLSIIVLGFIGSVPEHAISINSFYKNDSNSGLNNAFGSNLMMLGGVLPIFTILGWIMNISFSVVTFLPIFILIFITYILVYCAISDGIAHSIEGIVLFALYILIARILF